MAELAVGVRLVWLAFAVFTYWFAGISRSRRGRRGPQPGKGGVLSDFNNTGITLTIALYVVAVII